MRQRLLMCVLAVLVLALASCSGDTVDKKRSGADPAPSQSSSSAGTDAIESPEPSTEPSTEPTTEPPSPKNSLPRARLTKVARGLTAPIAMVTPPGQPERLLVVDQIGLVRRLGPDGMSDEPPFLDMRDQIVRLSRTSDDERGLLGLAFSPQFTSDRTVYTFHTAPIKRGIWSHVNVLSAYRTDATGTRVDPDSQAVLWKLPQRGESHAAGQLLFDPQGRLLVFLGDGLDASQAQDAKSKYGKVLRFDRLVPGSRPTTLASGMRHPWRVTRDPVSGRVYFAEPNFTSQYQEVNQLVEGANYAWGLRTQSRSCWRGEGEAAYKDCRTGPGGEKLRPPDAEYGPEDGLIISGVQVYRGTAIPALRGRMVAAEWGVVASGAAGAGKLMVSGRLGRVPHTLTPWDVPGVESQLFWSLTRDPKGELYVMTMAERAPRPGGGAIYRLVAP